MARSILSQAIAGHPSWQPRPAASPFGGNLGLQRASQRSQRVGPGAYGGNRGLTAAAARPQTIGSGAYGGNQGLQHAAGMPPQAPTVSSAQPGSPPPAPGTADSSTAPLDATYYANVAGHDFSTNNQINALNLAGQRDQTALASTLAQLAYQQPRSQLALEQRANSNGGLYSSVYDQNAADVVHQFAGRQDAAQQNYASQMDDIAAKIAGLQGGEQNYESEQAAASAGRAANQAALAAYLGMGTGSPSQPAPQSRPASHAPPARTPMPAGRTVQIGGVPVAKSTNLARWMTQAAKWR